MKKTIKLIILTFLFISTLTSCGEMLSVMSAHNQANGAKCADWASKISIYSNGKYEDGYLKKDEAWISNQVNYYVKAYKFGTYHLTSPNTNKEYKISVWCSNYYK